MLRRTPPVATARAMLRLAVMTSARDFRERPFVLDEALTILAHTPAALDGLLRGLPPDWLRADEGEGTWSPLDVVGHLIHADRTNWLPRLGTILQSGEAVPFPAFDRFASIEDSGRRSLADLLDEFARVRAESVDTLARLDLLTADLDRRGQHPAFGAVTLRQLIATWVTHDFDHLMQMTRVLGRQYATEVGPWRAYLRIVNDTRG
jgi:hypothetical protein